MGLGRIVPFPSWHLVPAAFVSGEPGPKEQEEEKEVVTEIDSLDEPNLSCLIQLLHRPVVA